MANATSGRCRRNAWRLLAAAPAVLLSTMLVTLALAGLTRLTLVAVTAWLLCAPLLLRQRAVERLVVQTMFHFRAPTGRDAEWLQWLRARSELVGATSARDFDWYVIEDARPNAFAAGRHSITITTGLLRRVSAGHLTPDEAIAVALHEIGHHACGDVRHGLVVWWLTWPWRTVRRFAAGLGRRIPLFGAGVLLAPVVVAVAIGRVALEGSSGAHGWWTITVLSAALLATYIQPVAEGAVARASERAADSFVVSLGLGPALETARQHLDRRAPDRARV